MPSATPRKSENVPSVTMSAGRPQARNQHRVQRAACAPNGERDGHGGGNGQLQIAPRRAETDRGQSHHGANRQVDAAANQNRRQRDGEQSELGVQPGDLEKIRKREEIRGDEGEDRHLGRKREGESGLMPARGGELHTFGRGAGTHPRQPRRE